MRQESVGLLRHKSQHASSGSFGTISEQILTPHLRVHPQRAQRGPAAVLEDRRRSLPPPALVGWVPSQGRASQGLSEAGAAPLGATWAPHNHHSPAARAAARREREEPHLDSEYLRLVFIAPGEVLVAKVGVLHVARQVGGAGDFPDGIWERGETAGSSGWLSCPVPRQPELAPQCRRPRSTSLAGCSHPAPPLPSPSSRSGGSSLVSSLPSVSTWIR